MEFVKSSAAVNGSCLRGGIDVSYETLVKVFGEPDEGDGYKTDAEWAGLIDGVSFTIYNWKNGKNYCGSHGLKTKDIRDWHIGGLTHKAVEKVKQFIVKKG